MKRNNILPNVATRFIPRTARPDIAPTAYVHPAAVVIGQATIGRSVFVAPFASVRGDEGVPIHIGDESNVQDGVVLHALTTWQNGREVDSNLCTVDGRKYAIYIGRGVSLAHQSQVHGPAVVEDGTFLGMQSLVLRASVGKNCFVEPGAKIIGVNIPEGRYVPANSLINTQVQADDCPQITPEYPYYALNQSVVNVNIQLAEKYRLAEMT